MKYPLMVIFAFLIFACKKNPDAPDPISQEDKARAIALSTFLETHKFELTRYFSETPIDYVDTDQVVKSETDLWPYVSIWLKDDAYTFDANGNVTVEQNTNRIDTDTSALLTRHYAVAADANGVGIDFIGHEYQVLKYRLISFTDSNLIMSASWNGKKVLSEYKTLP